MTKAEIACGMFDKGFNCSQSVLFAFANDLSLPEDTALKIANGFGGGMGRKQEVCGAVSGAIMVLGMIYGRNRNDGKEKQELTYKKVQQFIDEFKGHYGTVNCRELLSGCNLLTDDGQKEFKDKNLKEKCCEYVTTSCEILENVIK